MAMLKGEDAARRLIKDMVIASKAGLSVTLDNKAVRKVEWLVDVLTNELNFWKLKAGDERDEALRIKRGCQPNAVFLGSGSVVEVGNTEDGGEAFVSIGMDNDDEEEKVFRVAKDRVKPFSDNLYSSVDLYAKFPEDGEE